MPKPSLAMREPFVPDHHGMTKRMLHPHKSEEKK
jgi:hypothetical protein